MARKIVDIGVEGNDGTGDSIREGFRKVNENFQEIYAVFGQEGTLAFLDLGDVEGGQLKSYSTKIDQIPVVNSQGTGLKFKPIVGANGLTITFPSDPADPNYNKIVFTQQRAVGQLGSPDTPGVFGNAIDGQEYMLGNIKDPTQANVLDWNSKFGRSGQTVVSADKFPVTLGFADNRYINRGTTAGELADTMIGYLAVPPGASGDQVPQAAETVLKTGSTMTGILNLSDHPGDLAGEGTPIGADDLQAATKYYVDTTAYASKVNLYVSTNGDDAQTKTPAGREGRAWAYAYRTLVAACLRADQLISESPWELGPYRQLIAYGNGKYYSEIIPGGISIGGGLNGTTRIKFTNDSGSPVDQGIQNNKDIIPGKLVVGRDSGARGFIVRYGTDSTADYVDLRDVTGTFQVGENLYFDQAVKRLEISIFIESGTYYEDYPIKIPRNCSILGDEFRRTVIRPADRPSKSPWAATWFYRDLVFDNLAIAETNWGYHYLTDATNKASTPKNNKDLDVFLCNDATIIRQISCQGHGGFMMVLDPEGQILTKSPYCQQSGSFAGSLNKQAFRGGQYVDGQAGSLPVSTVSTNESFTEVTITDSFRVPQTPTAFFVEGNRYKIDTFTDNGQGYRQASELLLLNKDFIVAETIAYVNDVITPTFTYDPVKCSRDVGYILNAVAWDIALNSNVQSITVAQEYFIRSGYSLLPTQKEATLSALTFVKSSVAALLASNSIALARANDRMDTIIRIITNGVEDRVIKDSSAWSYNGTTITVTVPGGHGLGVNWSIVVVSAQSTTNAPNGTFNVASVVNDTTFTYVAQNVPTGTPGGILRFTASPIPIRSIPNPPVDPQSLQETVTGIQNSLARLIENRELIKAEFIAYINTYYPDFLFGEYGVSGYIRDIDRIVNAVIYDSLYGGNSQTVLVAKNYFDNEGKSNISKEVTQIYRGLEWARDVAAGVTVDTNLTGLLQVAVDQVRGAAGTEEIATNVSENFNIIINAVRFGITTLPVVTNPLIENVSTSLQSAKSLLDINANTLRADTIAFINNKYLYDVSGAQRDIRFLIDALAHDIVYTGNLKMVEKGLSYFVNEATLVSDAERPRTLAIIDYVKQLALYIVDNNDIPNPQNITSGNLVIGQTYKINNPGSTDWTALGAESNIHNVSFTATGTGIFTAGNFVVGKSYTIVSRGTTNFINYGASSNAIGTVFTATGEGSGTGTASQGSGTVRLASSSDFYRRQFAISQSIQIGTAADGVAEILPSLVWVNTTLQNAFQKLKTEKANIQSAIISWINNNIETNVNETQSIWYGFEYNSGTCSRDIGYIIDAIGYDLMFGSNFRSVKAGMAYYRGVASAQLVLSDQKAATIASFNYLKNYLLSTITSGTYGVANTRVGENMDSIIDILTNGLSVVPEFVYPDPSNFDLEYLNARRLINANREFVIDEIAKWIDIQKLNNYSPFTSTFTFDSNACARDIGYIIDAILFDLTYGGNLETLVAANAYFVGATSTLGVGEKDKTIAAYNRLKYVIGKVAQGVTILDKSTSLVQNTSGSGGGATTSVAFAEARVNDVIKKINVTASDSKPRVQSLVTTLRDMVTGTKGSGYKAANKLLVANRDFIKAEVVNYINYTYSFTITQTTSTQLVTESTTNMRVGMPVEFIGTDPFQVTILSASTPVEVDGLFRVTFTFNSIGRVPDSTKDYEIIGNANSSYNLIVPTANIAPPGVKTTYTTITVDYPANPGVFDYSNQTTIRVAGGVFGGVNRDTKYYVKQIISATNFTISDSYDGTAPGALYPLTSDVGTMYCSLAYNRATCSRDTGFIVSNIATDILYGGRYNTIKAGLRYYAGTASLVTGEQSPETRAGIAYINTLAQRIIRNTAPSFSYNRETCKRDVGLIVEAALSDVIFGTNYRSIYAGLSYLRSYSGVVIASQKEQTIAAINDAKTLVQASMTSLVAKTTLAANMTLIADIIDQGQIPIYAALTYTNPNNTSSNTTGAAAIIRANKSFLIEEVVAYINANLNPGTIVGYSEATCRRDVGYIIDALDYDLLYGGTVATTKAANAFISGLTNTIAGETSQNSAAYVRLKTAIQNVAVNSISWTRTPGNNAAQVTNLSPQGTATEVNRLGALLDIVIGVINTGTQVADGTDPTFTNGVNYSYAGSERTAVLANIENIKNGVISFLNATYGGSQTYQSLMGVVQNDIVDQVIDTSLTGGADASTDIAGLVTLVNDIILNGKQWVAENITDALEYPKYVLQLNEDSPYDPVKSGTLPSEIIIQGAGNTSMLSNDWTQLNDLGYGLVATNNGLIETVSVFTYYCWTAYYAKNGGQIRSVGGSNANGEYALVAEGSDPFEVPDSVALSDDMVQVATVFKDGPFLAEMGKTKTTVYIDNYNHLPYNISEIEINHGYDIVDGVISETGVTRYEIANVTDVSSTYFSTNIPTFVSSTQVDGKYRVKFSFPAKSYIPDTGRYYIITGNSSGYNNSTTGWLCVESSYDYIVLEFTSSNPGAFATSSTTIRLKPATILRLNLNTSGSNSTAASGLQKALDNNQLVTIRANQNFKFFNVDQINPTRPSTALTFRADPANTASAPVYRVLAFNTKDPLSNAMALNDPIIKNEVILTFDSGYSYVSLVIDQDYNTLTEAQAGIEGGSTTRTLGSQAGDKYLAVKKIGSANDILRLVTGEMCVAWNGRVHRIANYTTKIINSTTGYGIVELAETRKSTNGNLTSQYYQDNSGYGSTGITAPTRPGSGYNLTGGTYNSGTQQITYTVTGLEVAPNAPLFTGTISGTTLTVSAVSSGVITNGFVIQAISGSGITANTRIVNQLTSSSAAVATTTASGSSGGSTITVASASNILAGQIVSGTGIPDGTFVSSISGTTVTLSKALTATASGNYVFKSAGGVGTYTISISQTVGTPTAMGVVFTVYGNSNASYNISGPVLESTYTSIKLAAAPATIVANVAINGLMTVNYVSGNTIQLGQSISGAGIPTGTYVLAQKSGTTGGAGTYTLSSNPTVVTPVFTASINNGSGGAGTILNVSAVASGTILVGADVQKTSGTGVVAGTTITGQITGATVSTSTATGNSGTSGNTFVTVGNVTGIAVGQLITAANGAIPENTYVTSIQNFVVNISNALTANIISTTAIVFATAGGIGTYRVDTSQSVASGEMSEVFTAIPGNFGLTATRIFPANTLYNPQLVDGSSITLRAGLSRNEPADIIVNISTCRVTSHDFADIGTGGYNQSNYPSKIYGPGKAKNQKKEVAERGTGRVFWVSTDQDGFFRVGRFFTVDQGTGTVTFAASLALSNLDGLGFKRGRAISEFSDDDTFQDLSDSKVPTEHAIDGYLNRRLGIDRNSIVISEGTLGPGFLDRAGILEMNGNIKMNQYSVTNLLPIDPLTTPDDYAIRKDYLDNQQLADTKVDVEGRVNNDLLIYNGDRTEPKWVNAKSSSDGSQIQVELIADKELDIYVKNETITNNQIRQDAGIEQRKLLLNTASEQRDQGTLITSVTKSVGLTINGADTISSKSPHATIKLSFDGTTPKPTVGIYYTVSGNSNSNYNGKFLCVDSAARVGNLAGYVVLEYPEYPGVFGGTTTTVTPWETTITTQLDHGLSAGDTVSISNASVTSVSVSGNGTINTNQLSVVSGTGIGTGQVVTGPGIPAKTYVKSVNGTSISLTNSFTASSSGSYTFTTNINGNWTVQSSASATTFVIALDTRIAGTYTLTTARATKLGLSTFNKNQFAVSNGFVSLETSTVTTVTAAINASSNIVTVSAGSMANISVGNIITIRSGGGTVVMPTTALANPTGVDNGTQPTPVTVTAITSDTTFTVSTAFAGTGSAGTAVLNVITATPLSSIQQIETDSIIGNLSGSRTVPTTVTTGQIVKAGDGIKNVQFNGDYPGDVSVRGIMTVNTIDTNYPWKNTYTVFPVTKTGQSNSVVRTTADGSIEATSYILDGKLALDSSGGANLDFYTPGQSKFLTATGNSGVASSPNVSIGAFTTAVNTTIRVNAGGVFTVDSTANMYVGQEVLISGTPAFGGLANGGTYYITSIGTGTITLCLTDAMTPNFVGTNGSGTMSVTGTTINPGVLNGQVYVPKIKAYGTVTLNPINANVSLQPRSTDNTNGTVTIFPAVNGSINNMAIGGTSESTGKFTTVEVTSVTDAANSTTAPLKTAGGLAVAKKAYIGSDLNVGGNTYITGNLVVNGVTTTVNSSDLNVDDKNLLLASVGTTLSIAGDIDSSGVITNMLDSSGKAPTGLISGMVVTKTAGTSTVGTVGSTITVATVNSQSSITVTVSAGSITAGTITFTASGGNDSTADGGGITLKAQADKTITWVAATNRWTFNVGVESASGIQNTPIGISDVNNPNGHRAARFTSVTITDDLTLGNTDEDTVTITSRFVSGSQLKTSKSDSSTLSMSAYDVNDLTYKDLIKLTASNTPFVTITSDGLGTIDGIDIGQSSHKKGKFTQLDATSTVTLSPADANVSISPTGTGTLTLGSASTVSMSSSASNVTISSYTLGYMDGIEIGHTTPKIGAFTDLSANASVTFSGNVASTSKTTGTVKVTGGLGVSGDVYATKFYGAFEVPSGGGTIVGQIDGADKVKVINASDTNATYYMTFVDSNNSVGANETVYTDGALKFNPSTNVLETTTFKGALNGNADTASQVKTQTASDTDATYKLAFVDSHNATATAETVYTDDSLSYNPSTNTLSTSVVSATTFSGTLKGGITLDDGTAVLSRGTTAANSTFAGVSANADRWTTSRKITFSGAATGEVTFNGSADVTCALTATSSAATSLQIKAGSGSFNNYIPYTTDVSTTDGVNATFKTDGSFYYKPSTATVYATTFSGNASTANYADLAENYLADAAYEEGTVLIFGGELEVTASTQFNDRRVAGVVSLRPAYLMNDKLEGDHVVAIALQGRVPVKVLGRVQKGDLLVSSGRPGFAIVNNDPKPGTIIGKAIGVKTTDGDGIVEAVVGKH